MKTKCGVASVLTQLPYSPLYINIEPGIHNNGRANSLTFELRSLMFFELLIHSNYLKIYIDRLNVKNEEGNSFPFLSAVFVSFVSCVFNRIPPQNCTDRSQDEPVVFQGKPEGNIFHGNLVT